MVDEQRQRVHDECTGVDTGSAMSVSVALGVAAGCILGLLFGNVALYLALGVTVGVLVSYMSIVAGLTDAEHHDRRELTGVAGGARSIGTSGKDEPVA